MISLKLELLYISLHDHPLVAPGHELYPLIHMVLASSPGSRWLDKAAMIEDIFGLEDALN